MENLFGILILGSLILLVIGFFNPQRSLFWYKKEKTTKKSTLIYGITLVASFILFGIITDKNKINNNGLQNKNSITKATSESKKEQKLDEWREVYTFRGNGMKKSSTFELTGGEARLKYNYSSPVGIGMGMFAAYIVDEGVDIMKDGGIPDVMTSAEKEESETSIQKGAGRYYLNINASGNWIVTVEELK